MLEVRNISKSFGNIKAVQDVSFIARDGRIVGIVGKNGAGKSTIFRIVLDILPADNGRVLVDDKEYNILSSRKIGFLPEEGSLSGELTVYEQMCFYGSLRDMSEEEIQEKLIYWLDKFGIVEYLNRKIKELSKGNRQRLQFIVSVLHDPQIIILDEPFSGLDPLGVEIFKKILIELKEQGKIIIFSSHRMDHVEQFSDDLILLNNGKVLIDGELKKVKEEFIAKYGGESSISLNDMFIQLVGGKEND